MTTEATPKDMLEGLRSLLLQWAFEKEFKGEPTDARGDIAALDWVLAQPDPDAAAEQYFITKASRPLRPREVVALMRGTK